MPNQRRAGEGLIKSLERNLRMGDILAMWSLLFAILALGWELCLLGNQCLRFLEIDAWKPYSGLDWLREYASSTYDSIMFPHHLLGLSHILRLTLGFLSAPMVLVVTFGVIVWLLLLWEESLHNQIRDEQAKLSHTTDDALAKRPLK